MNARRRFKAKRRRQLAVTLRRLQARLDHAAERLALQVPCGWCGAPAGAPCRMVGLDGTVLGMERRPHVVRGVAERVGEPSLRHPYQGVDWGRRHG